MPPEAARWTWASIRPGSRVLPAPSTISAFSRSGSGPHIRAHFAGAQAFVFTGGVHEGEARQEGLQVEPEMALGGGFAAAVFGPIQAAGDQLEGGGIHQVDHAFEAEGKPRAAVPAKTGMEFFQMAEDRIEKVLGQLAGTVKA